MKTHVTKTDIALAAEIIKTGGLVGVPTETVYGLACDGLNALAVERIYEVKGRPETKPISLLVSGMDDVEKFCVNIPKRAYALAECFWPGPLTMILKKRGNVPDTVTAGGNSVGVRCPAHALTLALIKLSGVPLAAPSANLSGMPSPKNADSVLGYFDGKIECVIDGGEMRRRPRINNCRHDCRTAEDTQAGRTARKGHRKGARRKSGAAMIIGITGGTGTGKTTALGVLETLGAFVIDCDKLYHELLENCSGLKTDIEARFPGVVTEGKLDRKKLGTVVFADKKALSELNAITHRYITAEIGKQITREKTAGRRLFAIDAIALIESELAGMCDITVAVTAPVEVRARRIMAREGIDWDYAMLRIKAQQPDEYYTRNCGYTLVNDSDSAVEFHRKAAAFFKNILGGND